MNSYAQTGLILFLSKFCQIMHCFLLIFCGDTSGSDPFLSNLSYRTVQQIEVALNLGAQMKAEFTAIIEAAPKGGYWAICPEILGANGQCERIEESRDNL